MHSSTYQPAEAEDVDLFELLEQWEPTDNTVGSSSRTPFASAAAQACRMGVGSIPSSSRAAEVLPPVPGTPIQMKRPTPSAALQQYPDQAPDEATYPMYAPELYMSGRQVAWSSVPTACPPAAFTSWQQQPIYMPPQPSLHQHSSHQHSSAHIAQGTVLSHLLIMCLGSVRSMHSPPGESYACCLGVRPPGTSTEQAPDIG